VPARQGLKVIVFEAGVHPRFAVKAVREQARYSIPALSRQRRTRARLVTQTTSPQING